MLAEGLSGGEWWLDGIPDVCLYDIVTYIGFLDFYKNGVRVKALNKRTQGYVGFGRHKALRKTNTNWKGLGLKVLGVPWVPEHKFDSLRKASHMTIYGCQLAGCVGRGYTWKNILVVNADYDLRSFNSLSILLSLICNM